MLIALSCAACSPRYINAAFPEVSLYAPRPNAPTIGLAHVADPRISRVVATRGGLSFLAGPELDDYIERAIRNKLWEAGLNAIEALNPATSATPNPGKTILVTVQSASISNFDSMFSTPKVSLDLAIQIFLGGKIVFAQSYLGVHSEGLAFGSPSMGTGHILAAAADDAIGQAFADPQFKAALR
jgi:hypothetical protein